MKGCRYLNRQEAVYLEFGNLGGAYRVVMISCNGIQGYFLAGSMTRKERRKAGGKELISKQHNQAFMFFHQS